MVNLGVFRRKTQLHAKKTCYLYLKDIINIVHLKEISRVKRIGILTKNFKIGITRFYPSWKLWCQNPFFISTCTKRASSFGVEKKNQKVSLTWWRFEGSSRWRFGYNSSIFTGALFFKSSLEYFLGQRSPFFCCQGSLYYAEVSCDSSYVNIFFSFQKFSFRRVKNSFWKEMTSFFCFFLTFFFSLQYDYVFGKHHILISEE